MKKIYLDETEATVCMSVFVHDAPICYIDRNRSCFLIARDGRDFWKDVKQWKTLFTPCTDVAFFASKEEAKKKYEFLDRAAMEQSLREVERP